MALSSALISSRQERRSVNSSFQSSFLMASTFFSPPHASILVCLRSPDHEAARIRRLSGKQHPSKDRLASLELSGLSATLLEGLMKKAALTLAFALLATLSAASPGHKSVTRTITQTPRGIHHTTTVTRHMSGSANRMAGSPNRVTKRTTVTKSKRRTPSTTGTANRAQPVKR
jgi:hypothetical protein